YQWPFHSTRMLDYGSSLFDLAVVLEQQAGRKVYLDFLRNPEPVRDGDEFSLDDLDPDVRAYLENNESLLKLPIERLKRMNPLAIELYRMHGKDLCQEPLEFAMNNQHMNGGILINDWGETSLAGCYAIGEAAGSHGVTRPGGAALNSGQVFGRRVAIAIDRKLTHSDTSAVSNQVNEVIVEKTLEEAKHFVETSKHQFREVRQEVQSRMSEHAGILCSEQGVSAALNKAKELRQQLELEGIKASSAALVGHSFRWLQMAWVSEAVLAALDFYIRNGGGSRGARTICSDQGSLCPEASLADLSEFRFIAEQETDKHKKIVVQLDQNQIKVDEVPIDLSPEVKREFFEKGWGAYLIKEG
ncbi:MAG: FAD-binding protein, partial [Verrucomicrobiota bacterium]